MKAFSMLGVAMAAPLLIGSAPTANAQEIVHDAEYYVLAAQNGERWAAEDVDLGEKTAELREKFGPPQPCSHYVG